jgi:hypothetical protein
VLDGKAASAGDTDCSSLTDSVDAAVVLQCTAGLVIAVPCWPQADVNEDGRMTALDALLVLQHVAGLIEL